MEGAPLDPQPTEPSATGSRTWPTTGRQILGFFLGLAAGVFVSSIVVGILVRVDFPRGNGDELGLVFALIGLVQFVWLIPLAFVGWRRRNVGFLVGVLVASVPLLLVDALCFGPMYLFEHR
jgi:hypothetical protein